MATLYPAGCRTDSAWWASVGSSASPSGIGILTIPKGTLPLALFGPAGYGHCQGLLMLPARLAQALAPWLFGLRLAHFGTAALWFSAGWRSSRLRR
jgi:hypothetical protein